MTHINSNEKWIHQEKVQKMASKKEKLAQSEANEENEKNSRPRKYKNNLMKQYPELFRSDVSIHPSYTGLLNLPYYVVCRRRIQKLKKQINRRMNQEIMHMAMMQSHALASVRIDRLFNVGFPQEALHVPDFATDKERRRIRQLLNER
ncbi:uncharacterized protein [Chelonus insularis]|uniref:uncharacterized protein n=1 Tax=Chelonus insularis TaxID=460826 RepID=UPI00158B6897|nr:uncharacterized protein LOC118072147 [Chelonus insularis]